MEPDEILCRYVLMHEKERRLDEVHDGVAGGHFGGRATSMKIL